MDTLAHGLFGAAVLTPTRNEKLMAIAGAMGMLPDLVVQGAVIWETGFGEGLRIVAARGDDFPQNLMVLYRASHSLVAVVVIAVLLLAFKRKYLLLAAPYLLHVLFDVFTHCGLFGTRLFYPFSDWHFCGLSYADNLWGWEITYGVLVGIYFLIYWKFYRPYLRLK